MDADALWQQAAIGPDAVDVVQTYDDYPVISMLQFEDLGFCAKDASADFIRRNDLGPAATCGTTPGAGSSPADRLERRVAFWDWWRLCASSTAKQRGGWCQARAMHWWAGLA